MWDNWVPVTSKMATDVEAIVARMRREVETLRESERKLRCQEICCQKAKEQCLLKSSRSNQPLKEKTKSALPTECKADLQFSEIFRLLLEIKKQKKKLLMLKYQLHCEEVKQECGVLDDMLQKESEILIGVSRRWTHPGDEVTALAFWYSQIVHAMQEFKEGSYKGKFSQMNCLFYNVSYCNGEKQPRDLLAETILKKKMKRCQRTGREIEKLQFSTCYKGFCIQIVTSRTVNCVKRNEDGKASGLITDSDSSLYRCHSDIQLDQLQEHLLEHLLARKTPEIFVREYVWKELEKLVF